MADQKVSFIDTIKELVESHYSRSCLLPFAVEALEHDEVPVVEDSRSEKVVRIETFFSLHDTKECRVKDAFLQGVHKLLSYIDSGHSEKVPVIGMKTIFEHFE